MILETDLVLRKKDINVDEEDDIIYCHLNLPM